MVTGFIASLLTILCLVIARFAIMQRRKTLVAYGSGDDKKLQAVVSAHSNFATYTPIYLILSYIMEENFKMNNLFLLTLGMGFVFARALHFYGLCYKEHEQKPNFKFRITAMGLTFLTLTTAASINFFSSIVEIFKSF